MIKKQFCWNLPLLLTVALCVTQPCLSAPILQVVGWRGDGTGVYPDAQPPVKWSATENVIWKTPLPKKSNASPILVGDRMFVCSEPDTLLCVSAKDGTILWSSSTTYLDAVPEDQREQVRAQQARANELPNKLKELEAARDEKSAELNKTPDKPGLKEELARLESEIKKASNDLKALAFFVLPKTSEETGYATPTPVSDGQRGWAVKVVTCGPVRMLCLRVGVLLLLFTGERMPRRLGESVGARGTTNRMRMRA